MPTVVEGGSSETTSRAHVGGSSSSSGPSAPAAAPVPSSRKRGAGDHFDQASEPPGSQLSGAEASSPQGDPLARSGAVKRPAEGEPESRWRTRDETGPQSQEYEAKERRLNLIEDLVDVLEEEVVQVCIGDGEVQMRICEEPLDLSFIASPEAKLLEGAS